MSAGRTDRRSRPDTRTASRTRWLARPSTNVAPRRAAQPVKPEAPKPAGPVRRPVVVPCQYALDDQLARAVTRNVSETGVFIQTPAPAPSGVDLRFELMIHAAPMALRGVVVWMRRNADTGRPPGMGVRLAGPPKDYLEFVRSLPAPAAA